MPHVGPYPADCSAEGSNIPCWCKPVMPLKRSGVGGSCCAGPGRLQLLQAHGCGFGASTVQSWGHVAGFWATGPGFQPLDNLRFSNRTTFGWIFGIKHYQTFMFFGCLILSHLDSPVFQIRRFLKAWNIVRRWNQWHFKASTSGQEGQEGASIRNVQIWNVMKCADVLSMLWLL